MNPNPPVLEIRSLRKVFGGFVAVDDVSMELRRGEICALIGPNGAGKSTLFNMIAGTLRPTSGEVLMEGRILPRTPSARARCGIARTFQGSNTFGKLTCLESIETVILARERQTLHMAGRWRERVRAEAEALLKARGLERFAYTLAEELSQGDQRILEVATALALKPKVLLLDEPTAGMSPAETMQTAELVGSLVDDGELAVLLCEHDMEVVFSIADRVTVLDAGKLIAEGTPNEVRMNEAVVRGYLGAEPAC